MLEPLRSGDTVRLKGQRTLGLIISTLDKPEGSIYLVKWRKPARIGKVGTHRSWESGADLERA